MREQLNCDKHEPENSSFEGSCALITDFRNTRTGYI